MRSADPVPTDAAPAEATATHDEQMLADEDWDDLDVVPPKRTSGWTRLLAVLAVAALAFAAGAYAQRTWGPTSAATGASNTAPATGAGAFGAQNGARIRVGAGGEAGSQDVTTGQVKFIRGNVLYVETSDGSTVKVRVAKSVQVSKTQTTDVEGIDAGDQVVVQGTAAKNGVIAASRVTVGLPGAGFGGFFGGGSPAGAGGRTGTPSGTGTESGPSGGGAGFQVGG